MLGATIRMPDASRPSLRAEWPYALALLSFFVAAAVAVGAHRDVPVIDDWTYAWSVEQLRDHGRLAMLDWSAVFPVGPALWGTAWSLVFGFSFATLRMSTLVLAAVAGGALYLILRELEAAPAGRAARRADHGRQSDVPAAVVVVHDRRAVCGLHAAGAAVLRASGAPRRAGDCCCGPAAGHA